MRLFNELFGITVALATPLNKKGDFDEAAMKRLVDYTIESGVSAVFTLGIAGEGATLELATRHKVIETVVEASNGRVPVIAGVFDASTTLVKKHIKKAKELGADYVLTTPPNFYGLTQEEMYRFFLDLSDADELPVIAYNCSWAKNHLSPETVGLLMEHPNMAALKETSDMTTLQRMHEIISGRDDFILMSGEEFLFLPALAIGIKAFLLGGPGNILPKHCYEIIHDYQNGRLEEAAQKYNNMFSFLYRLYSMRILDMAAVKSVLELSGVCQRYVSKPFENPTDAEVEQIADLMKHYQMKLN